MRLFHLSKLSDLSEMVHDIDNYIVKENATNDVVAIIKRSKLRDWEAFHAASDVVKYLNLSEEEKIALEKALTSN